MFRNFHLSVGYQRYQFKIVKCNGIQSLDSIKRINKLKFIFFSRNTDFYCIVLSFILNSYQLSVLAQI